MPTNIGTKSTQAGIVVHSLRKVFGQGDTAVEALKSVDMVVGPGDVV